MYIVPDIELQERYIDKLESTLRGLREVSHGVYNFRCPICGDSIHDRNKKRGYLINKGESYYFYCHNCNESMNFDTFLRQVDSTLYDEYRGDRFKDYILKRENDKKDADDGIDTSKFATKTNIWDCVKKIDSTEKFYSYNNPYLIRCDKLKENNMRPNVINYLSSRKIIENEMLNKIYYTEQFHKIVLETFGNKYDVRKIPNTGIVFILRDLNNTVTGFQIRSTESNCDKKLRFKICAKENTDHFFFKEPIDISKNVLIVEGCIDSLFLNNSVAVLSSHLSKLKLDNGIYINDCEPRNESIALEIKKCIDKGLRTCLLPIDEFEGCDINDIILKGVTREELEKIILNHTYSGLLARVNYSKWRA